jgi:hypothetical protein
MMMKNVASKSNLALVIPTTALGSRSKTQNQTMIEKNLGKIPGDKKGQKIKIRINYQETNLTKVLESMIPALASKMDEWVSPTKSVETTWSSVYSKIPFMGPLAASLILAQISS